MLECQAVSLLIFFLSFSLNMDTAPLEGLKPKEDEENPYYRGFKRRLSMGTKMVIAVSSLIACVPELYTH